MKQQSSELKKTKKKVYGLGSKLKQTKLAVVNVDQLKLDLAATMEARDAGYVSATKAQNEDVSALAQRDKALQDFFELPKVACGSVYERVFNRGISSAGNSYDRQVAELCPAFIKKIGSLA